MNEDARDDTNVGRHGDERRVEQDAVEGSGPPRTLGAVGGHDQDVVGLQVGQRDPRAFARAADDAGPALAAVVGGQVDSMIVPVALAKAQAFAETLTYVPLADGAAALRAEVAAAEAQLGADCRRLHYLSVPPKAALDVIHQLKDAGANLRKYGTKVIGSAVNVKQEDAYNAWLASAIATPLSSVAMYACGRASRSVYTGHRVK